MVPIGLIRKQTWACKKDTQDLFMEGLETLGFWEAWEFSKKPTKEILIMPDFIGFVVNIPFRACISCHRNANASSIRNVRLKIMNDFHGLCLDCMQQTKTDSVHEDYWKRDMMQQWDKGCRIKHGEPTWNFSFMGSKTDMEKYWKEKAKKQKQLSGEDQVGLITH
jgi:hypothetical protein